mmetsp:Transcript_9381/g.24885  ORF Transcript_9381/g.24885 Transcript_9381/m.24885 type:complete len:287 (-) Transcript_9381:4953-5813(-)
MELYAQLFTNSSSSGFDVFFATVKVESVNTKRTTEVWMSRNVPKRSSGTAATVNPSPAITPLAPPSNMTIGMLREIGSTMSSSETPKTFDSDAPAVSTSSESSFESDPDEARSPAAPRVARRAAAKPPRATPRRACTPHGNETHTARPPRATTPSQQQPPRTANAARAADVRISILRTVIKPQLHQPFSPLQRCVQSFLLHSYRCGQHTHHFCFCCCVFFWSTTNLQLFSSAQSTFSSHFGQSSRLQHVEHCFNRGSSRLESALFEKPPPSRCLRDAPSRIRCERA